MFEVSRDYPTALAADPLQPDLAVASAIRWVLRQREEVGGRILLFAPGKANISDNEAVTRFINLPLVVLMTWRQLRNVSWGGGPVLALWPSREKLAAIADHYGTRALCVVPWADGEVDAWQAAVRPELLLGAKPLAVDPTHHLDPVVIEGLRSLTLKVNHANNLAGSMDKRDAISILTVLHREGYSLPPRAIYAWALSNGWPGRGAERLGEMATKIGNGVRMRGGGPDRLRPDIVEIWRSQAGSPSR